MTPDAASTLAITRNAPLKHRFSLLDEMIVERGTKADYETLHHLHYKAENVPPDPHYWRCVRRDQLVGVVVLSGVGLLSAPRHRMLPRLKPGQDSTLTNKLRPHFLNDNLRRAARIVTSPIYRGVGVTYRMVNLACRMEGFRFVEIMSSMTKFNPFDSKAGFVRAPTERAACYEKGLGWFRERFDAHPCDHNAIMTEYEHLSERQQQKLFGEMVSFYYKNSAREKTGQNLGKNVEDVAASMSFSELLQETQQLVFALMIYGLYPNPDWIGGRKTFHGLSRLPLLAFDFQAPTSRLNIEKLDREWR